MSDIERYVHEERRYKTGEWSVNEFRGGGGEPAYFLTAPKRALGNQRGEEFDLVFRAGELYALKALIDAALGLPEPR